MINLTYLTTCVSIGLMVNHLSIAQSDTSKPKIDIEAGVFFSSSSTNPFWVRSNQYGEIPLESQGLTIRGQIRKDYSPRVSTDKHKNRFSYGYGLRAVANAGQTNQVLLPELYGKVRYGALELFAGRRREVVGLVDTTLTTGSYIWSGNALPVPKIEISIQNYIPITANGLLAVKGNFSHGWLGNSDSVRNILLHQKSLYVRLGKPNWRFKLHAGFNHQVQWGGDVLYPRMDEGGVRVTKFGTDLESYVYVVTGKSLYTSAPLVVQNNTASAEGGNRVGNHLGTVDLAIEYNTPNTHWFLYKQSIYEAGALYYLNNIADGLHGLSYTRKQAKQGILKVVLEYLQTTSQGGPYTSNRSTIEYLRGAEDYMNNGRYIDGWVYKRQTIGTPFIMPLRYTTGLPQDLDPNPYRIVNNRVQVVSLSVQSRVKQVELLSRISVGNNLGSYTVPIDKSQISVQQRVIFPYQKYTFTSIVAYDSRGVLEPNIGCSLVVKRSLQ
ncbi:capsule assembly Wzi family protein [Spirosoma aerophilum]